MDLNKNEMNYLGKITTATAGEAGLVYIAETKTAKKLVDAGLIEVNPNDMKDGKAACRATAEGISLVMKPVVASESASDFELETGIEMPTARRGRSGSTRYPFDAMEVGQSFHIAATEENENPAKKIASSVSSTIKRYRNEDGTKGRDYAVRRVTETDPKGVGARIFRVA